MQLLALPRGVLTLGDPLLLLLLWMQQTSTGTMRTNSSSKLASAAAARHPSMLGISAHQHAAADCVEVV
jgi:hypothetical protein